MAFDGTGGNCWAPDWGYDVAYEQRLRIAKLGDGYEQRAIDGLNPLWRTFQLTWATRPKSVLIEMNIFLASQYGAAFEFMPPHAANTLLVFCDKWSISWTFNSKLKGTQYGDLKAEFREAFGSSVVTVPLP